MAQFINPFIGVVPKMLNPRELTRAIRQSLAAEEEAVHFYEAIVDATNDALAKKIFQNIADEEKVHIGEFQALLNRLAGDEVEFLEKGMDEVCEIEEDMDIMTAVNELAKVSGLLEPEILDDTGLRGRTSGCPICSNGDDEEYLMVQYGDDNLKVVMEQEEDDRYEIEVLKLYPDGEWKEIEEYYFDTIEEAKKKFDEIVKEF